MAVMDSDKNLQKMLIFNIHSEESSQQVLIGKRP